MARVARAYLLFCIIVIGVFAVAGDARAAKPAPLKFVSGYPSKTGCLVCHADHKIIKTKTINKTKINLYVSESTVLSSAHKDLACISCHKDFERFTATKEHDPNIPGYKITAALSCKNCHDHSKQLQQYSLSVHGKTASSVGEKRGATCVDCHGSHEIKNLKKDSMYREQFRFSSAKICGKCHKAYADSYNDYYHGKAYNQMAKDAPVCWDCHGAHSIQPKNDPASKVSDVQLSRTCEKCHVDARIEFVKQYSKMIHGSKKVQSSNFIISTASKIWSWVNVNLVDRVRGYL